MGFYVAFSERLLNSGIIIDVSCTRGKRNGHVCKCVFNAGLLHCGGRFRLKRRRVDVRSRMRMRADNNVLIVYDNAVVKRAVYLHSSRIRRMIAPLAVAPPNCPNFGATCGGDTRSLILRTVLIFVSV